MKRLPSWPLAAVLATLGLLAGPLVASGQTAIVPGSVTVLLAPASGAGVRPLTFGTVTPGVSTAVDPTSGNSGQFVIENVPKSKNVEITFTLPKWLTRTGGGPTITMPISFAGDYAQSCGNGCQTHTLAPTSLNASQNTATAEHVRPGPPFGPNPRTIDVFLGGEVQPTANQAAGTYQGTVELSFAIP